MKIKDVIKEAKRRPTRRSSAPTAPAPVVKRMELPVAVEKFIAKFAADPVAAAEARKYAEYKASGGKLKYDYDYGISSATRRRIEKNLDTIFYRQKRISDIGQNVDNEIEMKHLPHALQALKKDLLSLGFTRVDIRPSTRRDSMRNIAEIWLCLDANKMQNAKGVFKWHAHENMVKDGGWKDAHGIPIGFGLLSDHYYTKKIDMYNYILRIAGSPMTYQDWDGNGGALKVWLKMPTWDI